jgi:hypothetical protein
MSGRSESVGAVGNKGKRCAPLHTAPDRPRIPKPETAWSLPYRDSLTPLRF